MAGPDAGRLRDLADLAGSPGDVAVLAAPHHTADAIIRARHDLDSVRHASELFVSHNTVRAGIAGRVRHLAAREPRAPALDLPMTEPNRRFERHKPESRLFPSAGPESRLFPSAG